MDSDLAESMLRAAKIPYHLQGERVFSTVYTFLPPTPTALWAPSDRAEEAFNVLSGDNSTREAVD